MADGGPAPDAVRYDTAAAAGHAANLARVYGGETWSVYDELDRSLDPRGPHWLHARAGEHLGAGAVILDMGCRDGADLIELARAHEVAGVGLEPVAVHVERARAAVTAAGLDQRIRIVHGAMEECDYPAGHFDFVWCRDVLEQVQPLAAALRRAARVLKPGGRMLVFTVVATGLLEPAEAAMLGRHLGNVPANLDESTLLGAFGAARLAVQDRDVIGTEWREYAEERHQPVSRALLRLARLRRQRERIVAGHGEDIYRHIEANLHWEVFQFLGKLEPVVYLLRRA